MFLDLLVGVDAHDEVVAHHLGLTKRIGVPKVNHVVTPVAPNANLKQDQFVKTYFEVLLRQFSYFVKSS